MAGKALLSALHRALELSPEVPVIEVLRRALCFSETSKNFWEYTDRELRLALLQYVFIKRPRDVMIIKEES